MTAATSRRSPCAGEGPPDRSGLRRVADLLRVPALGPRAGPLGRKVVTQLVLANALAGALVTIYLTLVEELPDGTGWGEVIGLNAVLYGVLATAFCAVAAIRAPWVFADAFRWLDRPDPVGPSPDERRALLRQPVRVALFPLRYWAAAAVVSVIFRVAVHGDTGQVAVGVGAILQGGAIAAGIGYLLTERTLRPAFAEAFAGHPPETPTTVGIAPRLLLAWFLGAGLPLIGIATTPLVASEAELPLFVPMAVLAGIGLLAGAALTVGVAGSIAGPVRKVRNALAGVAGGDLDTEVVVDDGGELGQLQAGVNEMVTSLRERARLEDLFSRHVGTEVARRAIDDGVQLGGAVRPVSALFVDLVGSTELAMRLPPDEVVGLLNRFFATVVGCSDAHGGWVDKFAGDAALCVFGAPGDQPDHATRALRMARALRTEIDVLRHDVPDLDAGIGVATGLALAGHIGTETRLEYTVIGSPVNVAARLTVAAKQRPGRVLADAGAIEAAEADERRRWTADGTVDLKGLPPGLPVWGEVPAVPVSAIAATATGGAPVGRAGPVASEP